MVGSQFKILVVEDNDDDVVLLEQAFLRAGVNDQLFAVNDGRKAVQYLKGEGVYSDRAIYPFPDFVLLDLNMPTMNGFEFLKWLRQDEKCSRLVVHVLTSSTRDSDSNQAYDLRANSYLVKPGRLADLSLMARAMHDWHQFTLLPVCKDAYKTALLAG